MLCPSRKSLVIVSWRVASAVWVPIFRLNPCFLSFILSGSSSVLVSRLFSILSKTLPWMSSSDIGLYLVTSVWLRLVLGMKIIIAFLNAFGKYPIERVKLSSLRRAVVMFFGKLVSCFCRMPVGPGALFLNVSTSVIPRQRNV